MPEEEEEEGYLHVSAGVSLFSSSPGITRTTAVSYIQYHTLFLRALALFSKEMEDRTSRNRVLSEADKVDLEGLRDRSVESDARNWIGHDFAKWMIDDRLMELLFSAEFLHTETLKR